MASSSSSTTPPPSAVQEDKTIIYLGCGCHDSHPGCVAWRSFIRDAVRQACEPNPKARLNRGELVGEVLEHFRDWKPMVSQGFGVWFEDNEDRQVFRSKTNKRLDHEITEFRNKVIVLNDTRNKGNTEWMKFIQRTVNKNIGKMIQSELTLGMLQATAKEVGAHFSNYYFYCTDDAQQGESAVRVPLRENWWWICMTIIPIIKPHIGDTEANWLKTQLEETFLDRLIDQDAILFNGAIPLELRDFWLKRPHYFIIRVSRHGNGHPNGVPRTLSFLINKFPDALCVKETKYGCLPLHVAVRYEASYDLLEAILRAYPDAVKTPSSEGDLPLHSACMSPSVSLATVLFLVRQYENAVCVKNQHGHLPLHLACMYGVPRDVIEALCSRFPGGLKTQGYNGHLPLHSACMTRPSLDRLLFLIENYPQALSQLTFDGELPLHLACKYGASLNVMQVLHGKFPSGCQTKDTTGRLPLDYARASGWPTEAIRFLCPDQNGDGIQQQQHHHHHRNTSVISIDMENGSIATIPFSHKSSMSWVSLKSDFFSRSNTSAENVQIAFMD